MSHLALVLVLAVVAVLVVAGISLAMRPRVQRGWFVGTGVDRWRTTASGLPWRDRWVLFWANSLGRAAPPHLAPLAVQRGEAVLAMTERMLAKGSRVRRFWWAVGIVWAVLLVLAAARLVAGDRGTDAWIMLAADLVGLLTVVAAIGPVQVWQARLIRRSIDANRSEQGH